MNNHESLYEILKLKNFATTDEIESRWRRYTNENRLVDKPHEGSEDIETAFRILRNLQSKQLYDLLLDAFRRSDKTIPRLASKTCENELLQLAVLVNINLQPIAPMTYRVVKAEPTRVFESDRMERNTFPVGGSFLAFTPIRFFAEFEPFENCIVICVEDNPDSRFLIQGNFRPVRIGSGDTGVVVKVGTPNEPPRYNAAYINFAQEYFGPLNVASDHFFPADNLEIAQRFGLRNSVERIQQTIFQYYDALAESMGNIDPRIDVDMAKKSFRKLARTHHSQFH